MKKAYGIGLIMIDYLQLLNCREYAKQGRQLETSAISAQIKTMAKELNIPVIVLSQLSRAPEQRGEKSGKPRLSDLRDSGAIEQDADVVLLLRRPCKYPGDKESEDTTLAIVDVAKHRNGPVGEVRLNFDDKFTQFTDRAEGFATDDGYAPIPASESVPEPLE
jgi:replicative DNA helicase